MINALSGTGTLIRLILRRDRIALPIWILLVALAPIGIASSLFKALLGFGYCIRGMVR